MNTIKWLVFFLVVFPGLMLGLEISAAKSAYSDGFNLAHPNIELKELNRKNFYDRVITKAKRGKKITFYNFAAGSFPDLFRVKIIPKFEQKYGIKINFQHVKKDVAVQQLLAAKRAGKEPPADVFFMPDETLNMLLAELIVASINYYSLLPNTEGLAELYKDSGIFHGGSYLRFHRNQTAIGYNSRMIKMNQVPTTFEGIYRYARDSYQKNQRPQVAITSPVKGGSGTGFLIAVANAKLWGTPAIKGFKADYETVEQAKKWLGKNRKYLMPVWDFFRKIIPFIEFTNGNADTLNLISNGIVHFGTVWEDMVFGQISTGDTSKFLRLSIPKRGMPGTYNGIIINADTKNLAASLLLLDYLLSLEVQKEKLEFMASRSPNPNLSTRNIAKEKRKYLVPDADIVNSIGWVNVNLQEALKLAFIKEVMSR